MSSALSRLTIDLAALAANWRKLAALTPTAATGAAVKADAYGLGAQNIVPTLYEAGCRDFFVAQAGEGIAIRKMATDAHIFVLGGVVGEIAGDFAKHGLIPVLNHLDDLERWRAYAAFPCALHFDSGMNRLGFEQGDTHKVIEAASGFNISLVMSHLACSELRSHAMNSIQLARFRSIASQFPAARKSLANSGGVFLGGDYHFDLTRPGIAIYGGTPVANEANPMSPVATYEAKILQIRSAAKGETVGYGASATLSRDSRIAIAGAGYADGIARGASGRAGGGGFGWVAGNRAPILGRVSMDLTAFDVTDVPSQALEKARWVEFFGKNIALDDFAATAGTISYEVLTGMGNRAGRVWVGDTT